jgi:hypothetical protein
MTATTDTKKFNVGNVFTRTCRQLSADFLAEQTVESLAEIHAVCSKHWSRHWIFQSWLLAFGLGALCFVVGAGFVLSQSAPDIPKGITMALPSAFIALTLSLGAALGLLRKLFFTIFGLERYAEILEAVAPLKSQPFICQNLLTVLEESPSARAYRDRIVKSGRELIVADSRILYQVRYQDKQAQFEANAKSNCLRVHGLVLTQD